MRVTSPDGRQKATLAPDGILHSKYTGRKVGKGTYVFCWRKALEMLPTTAYKRISQHLVLPSSLADHVAHLLRLRVLQELELLTEQVEFAAKMRFRHTSVLRKLTCEEWRQLQLTKTIPYKKALAVLVSSPQQKNPDDDEKILPSMSPLPPQDQDNPLNAPPVCEMLPSKGPSHLPGSMLHHATPLYNAISAFPSLSQRAALHALLLRLLSAERTIQRRQNQRSISKFVASESAPPISNDAFLLSSTMDRDQHGDPTALAIALWRLHMYERSAWSNALP
ncbi:hypothetical protein CVT24_008721 [Panaeolus cyanescens]|uniref:Uncharacterized protein n=1 Tax=Panaeolus cyanescens TaxID=181874 RepID=A0A409VKH9_9AGAR|nr:hypothetical protein CVT24_008721 [Panaeolus cyanescens]